MAISIVVAYSPRAREVVEMPLKVERGCTVGQVLQCADFLAQPLAVGFEVAGFGVWGRKASKSDVLQEHDRLEIYRALTVDPKVARRERFVKQGAKKAAGLFANRRIGAKAGY
jgi:putative ubiquitin-RnfH superfamily antitoxin RatB of RatAB toxin-antitoxin module